MRMKIQILSAIAIGVFILARFMIGEAKQGERCDGFFTNGCAAPSTCVEVEKGSYCSAGSCSEASSCPAGFECYNTTYGGVESGGLCLPVVRE